MWATGPGDGRGIRASELDSDLKAYYHRKVAEGKKYHAVQYSGPREYNRLAT